MRYVITPECMRALEAAFIADGGATGLALMERAAAAIADRLLLMTDGGVLFLCGPGNNGGDGYAAARLLMERGRPVWIWALTDPERLSGDALLNMRRCAALGIAIHWLRELPAAPPEGCGAVVDALFGTGLQRPLDGLFAEAVRWINASGLPVLAVDMPSGTTELMVRADATVTFHRMKPVHLLFPGRLNTGALSVVPIGLPDDSSPEDFLLLDDDDIPRLLPARPMDAHKGTAGHALVVTGSYGMAGAAALCAGGALRGGAGLVTVCCPEAVLPSVQVLSPCAMCVPFAGLSAALDGKAAVAAGPGLGRDAAAGALLSVLLKADIPQVWDADALNWLAENPARLGNRFVLTPHPGEAARLLGKGTAAIVSDPVGAALALHEQTGAVIVLKGATTTVIGAGRRALSTAGTPGMATGGSGDVLTGIIAALLAQGLAPFDAAQLGAHLHGRAGEAAAHARGVRSMIAEDILHALRIE